VADVIRSIRPVIHGLQLAWWRWARRELQQMNPHHRDLALILRRIRELEAERA
jgi:hypothetical protein